jgi:hypothetical protein
MIPPLSGTERQRVAPQTHWIEISARMMKLCISVPSAFFCRTMPP